MARCALNHQPADTVQLNSIPIMQINFQKAHKLIDGLEEKLKATVGHTGKAREVLEELRKSGEEKLRRKTADALKLVRKKADSFVESLSELEGSLAKSLEKVSASLEKPAELEAGPKSAKAAPKAKKTPAKKATKTAPAAKRKAPAAAKKKAPAKK